jgi:hypothetical protein
VEGRGPESLQQVHVHLSKSGQGRSLTNSDANLSMGAAGPKMQVLAVGRDTRTSYAAGEAMRPAEDPSIGTMCRIRPWGLPAFGLISRASATGREVAYRTRQRPWWRPPRTTS